MNLYIFFLFQFTIATEQWKPTSLDVNQLYYYQILEQYLLSYYNYLNQNFILKDQKLNYPNNIIYTDPMPIKTKNINPINVLQMENVK